MNRTAGRTLYVSDLDGTLLGADSLVSARSASMLGDAINRGALFTVATARTPATVSRLLSAVPMSVPAIVMTGAALWDSATGEYSHPRFMSEDAALEIADIYRHVGLPSFAYALGDGRIEIFHTGELSALEREFVASRADTPFKTFHLDEKRLPSELAGRVLLYYAMQPNALAERAYGLVKDMNGINPIFYHDIFGPQTAILEVFSAGSSKAAAARELASERGADRIVAFGDNLNDLPLMRAADISVAVENAVDEVKAEADIVIGPNTADSVASFILEDMERDVSSSPRL